MCGSFGTATISLVFNEMGLSLGLLGFAALLLWILIPLLISIRLFSRQNLEPRLGAAALGLGLMLPLRLKRWFAICKALQMCSRR